MSNPNSQPPAIVWFRNDLRIADNPALSAAIKSGSPVICLYIYEEHDDIRPIGGASKWWLHHSLTSLKKDLEALGGNLVLRRGNPTRVIAELTEQTGSNAVFWNRRYDPACVEIDKYIKADLQFANIQVKTFNGSLLFEPWEIVTGGGTPYKVFSPFWRACLSAPLPSEPLPKPKSIHGGTAKTDNLEDWHLLPTDPNWASGFDPIWQPGEADAHAL